MLDVMTTYATSIENREVSTHYTERKKISRLVEAWEEDFLSREREQRNAMIRERIARRRAQIQEFREDRWDEASEVF